MDEIFYDPALFDIPYEYQEYPTGDTVEEDNLSADLFGALIQTDAQLPPTPACFGDFTDCPLAPRLSMADYASTSRMSQHEGISNYNIKTRIPDFMRTGGVTTGITPTLPTAAPTLVDYSDNTGTSSIKYSVFDDLAHNQDASPSRDFFSSSGTVSLPSQFYTNSDNSLFDMIAQRGFGSEISSDGHCLSELLYTNNVGPEMAHLFGNVLSSNDMSHGIASPTVEDFSNFPTADPAEDNVIPLPGDGFTQSTNPVPAPQSSSATMNIAPPTQVQRGTARRVAARRNPKGYFHGLPGRDGQNRHNIGRHWSEMTPEFGSVPNRPYEFHEMVAKRWLPYKWSNNQTNESADSYVRGKSQVEQDDFHHYWVRKFEEDRRNNITTILRRHNRHVARVRTAEVHEETRLEEKRRRQMAKKVRQGIAK